MNTNIIKQKQYILLLSRLMCKKNFEQKRFAGRHLLTFESQKLNYFSRFLVIFYPLSPRTPF